MRNAVTIRSFRQDSSLVLEEAFDIGDYYDSEIPAIDDENFRTGQGIARIEALFYNDEGILYQHWRTFYASDGLLQSSERWRNDEAEWGWITVDVDLPADVD